MYVLDLCQKGDTEIHTCYFAGAISGIICMLPSVWIGGSVYLCVDCLQVSPSFLTHPTHTLGALAHDRNKGEFGIVYIGHTIM